MSVDLLFLEFKEAFKIFDVDNSQTITTDELLLVMKNLGMMATKDEVKDMLSEVDEDGTLAEKGEWAICVTHTLPSLFPRPSLFQSSIWE